MVLITQVEAMQSARRLVIRAPRMVGVLQSGIYAPRIVFEASPGGFFGRPITTHCATKVEPKDYVIEEQKRNPVRPKNYLTPEQVRNIEKCVALLTTEEVNKLVEDINKAREEIKRTWKNGKKIR